MSKDEFDFAIIGGGVVGLSIAWELSACGSVAVIERGTIGREASWAGAGILPPFSLQHAVHPIEKLSAHSWQLHPDWAARLRAETGIDNGFRKCGALFVARTMGEHAALVGQISEWRQNGIRVRELTFDEVLQKNPCLASHSTNPIRSAAFLPDEYQIRNPDHLRALKKVCLANNVALIENAGDGHCDVTATKDNKDLQSVTTGDGRTVRARRFCLAAGAWSGKMAASIGVRISMLPVRGQILLFKLPKQILTSVIYEGTRYIVPRDDGHVLVGSTLEEAGFDKSTTEDAIHGLQQFAQGLAPALTTQVRVDQWAGLRPASFDGFPYIGRASACRNLWIATGHFRWGLLQSTATAVVMRQLMTDQQPMIDVAAFRPDRG